MKTANEICAFILDVIAHSYNRPTAYGLTPGELDAVVWQWHRVWAEVTERIPDFFNAMEVCDDGDARMTALRFVESCEQSAFQTVVDFWRSVDDRLGIKYEPPQ